MALVIENGTVVAGANSFVTVAEARTWASARSLPLPAADADVEVLLVKAVDYLLWLEANGSFQGKRSDPAAQELPFPRVGVVLFGTDLASDVIPSGLKQGQIALAVEAVSTNLLPAETGLAIKKKKVDVLETEWFERPSANPVPTFPRVEALLGPLFENAGSSVAFELVRA